MLRLDGKFMLDMLESSGSLILMSCLIMELKPQSISYFQKMWAQDVFILNW